MPAAEKAGRHQINPKMEVISAMGHLKNQVPKNRRTEKNTASFLQYAYPDSHLKLTVSEHLTNPD